MNDDEKPESNPTASNTQAHGEEFLLEILRELRTRQNNMDTRITRMEGDLWQRVNFWGKVVSAIIAFFGVVFLLTVGFKVWDIDHQMEQVRDTALKIMDRATETTAKAESRLNSQLDESQKRLMMQRTEIEQMTSVVKTQLSELLAKARVEVESVRDTRSEIQEALNAQQKSVQELYADYLAIKKSLPGGATDQVEVLHQLACVAVRRGDVAKAVSFIKRALRDSVKGNSTDFHNLGVVAEGLDDQDLALEVFQTGLKKHPSSRTLRRDVATQLGQHDRDDEAEAMLKALIEEDPTDAEPIARLADFYQRKRRYEEAIKHLSVHIAGLEKRKTPQAQVAVLYREMATTYASMDMNDKACEFFDKAIIADPVGDVAFGQYALMLARQADRTRDATKQSELRAKSLDVLERGLAVSTRNDSRKCKFYRLKAAILVDVDDLPGAEEALKAGLLLEPANMAVRSYYAKLLRSQGKPDEALQILLGRFSISGGKVLFKDLMPSSKEDKQPQ